jgi:hypothetical protein
MQYARGPSFELILYNMTEIVTYTTKDLLLKPEKITLMELVAVNNGKEVG